MLVKRVKKTNVYDVFLGSGWENHSRIIFPAMKVVSGNTLPRKILARVFHHIKGE